MVTDVHIGFLEEPAGLEEILANEGYVVDEYPFNDCVLYTRLERPYPEVLFMSKPPADEREYFWPGYDVTSAIEIFAKEDNADADRLQHIIVEQYDVVTYDSGIRMRSRPRQQAPERS